jgi:hypothetical protein
MTKTVGVTSTLYSPVRRPTVGVTWSMLTLRTTNG